MKSLVCMISVFYYSLISSMFCSPEQEKDLFLHKCLECLQMERPRFSFSSDAQKAATVCKNLRNYHFYDCFNCTLQTLSNSLFATCIFRFIVGSCRIFNSYFFKRGGCTALKVIHASNICREQLFINYMHCIFHFA